MSCEIRASARFRKEAKRLGKKYFSLREEITALEKQLSENPQTGEPLGLNCYKIRLAIKSKGKGKSGGARVITHLVVAVQTPKKHKILYLLTIYDKSELNTIGANELKKMVKEISELS